MFGQLREWGWTAAFLIVEIYLLVRGLWLGALIAGAWLPISLLAFLVLRRRASRRRAS